MNITVFDQHGNVFYEHGAGSTEITVVGIGQIVFDREGNIVWQWPWNDLAPPCYMSIVRRR